MLRFKYFLVLPMLLSISACSSSESDSSDRKAKINEAISACEADLIEFGKTHPETIGLVDKMMDRCMAERGFKK